MHYTHTGEAGSNFGGIFVAAIQNWAPKIYILNLPEILRRLDPLRKKKKLVHRR